MRACFKQFGLALYDRTAAPLVLKVQIMKTKVGKTEVIKTGVGETEVIKTLLFGCVALLLRETHFAKLSTAHHQVLLRVIAFQRRLCADHAAPLYAKALMMTRRDSIETTIRER